MSEDLMVKFHRLIEEGIKEVGNIEDIKPFTKEEVNKFQDKLMDYAKKVDLPNLCSQIIKKYPEKKPEIQRRIVVFQLQGRKLENSLYPIY